MSTQIEEVELNLPQEPVDKHGRTNRDYVEASKQCHSLFTNEQTLEEAWARYSHRERYYWGPQGRTGLNTPVWTGQDLKGKTLVLCYEQALGEQILFSSMIQDLLKLGCKLVIEVDKRLVTLLQRSFPEVTVVAFNFPWHKAMYTGDYYTLFGSVGYYLRKNKASFGEAKPYLVANPLKLDTNLPKVGLSWYSPMKYGDEYKGIDYKDLTPLTEKHEKSLFCINLQYGLPNPTDIHSVPDVDLTKDIDTVASIINDCDYVVTISNTVAHMAGALGKKTFLLLKEGYTRLWYWSWPWYANVQIIEKSHFSTWEKEIRKIYERITD